MEIWKPPPRAAGGGRRGPAPKNPPAQKAKKTRSPQTCLALPPGPPHQGPCGCLADFPRGELGPAKSRPNVKPLFCWPVGLRAVARPGGRFRAPVWVMSPHG